MTRIFTLLTLLVSALPMLAQTPDSTLRLDYVLGISDGRPAVMLHEVSKLDGWGGRTVNLDRAPLQGNGQVVVTDQATGRILYRSPFSTLYQEWLHLPGADSATVSFEHTVEVPLPECDAVVKLLLFDNRRDTLATHTYLYSPAEILVRERKRPRLPHRVLHASAHPSPISVAILAEGYREDEADTFYADAQAFVDELLSYEPFCHYTDRLQLTAIATPSVDSGVSSPQSGRWLDTPFGSHFDTFHMDRYLTSPRVWDMHTAADAVPTAHIIVLANTDQYGGGGIYNNYALTAAHVPFFRPVAIHEFGHSFGGLADEYFYDDEMDGTYALDAEPWEPNITTLVDFASKWEGTPDTGLFEGGGYRSKGIYRPAYNCRMRTNEYPAFCPACRASLERTILFLTEPVGE
ncbi:MAG: IgA Peptidase M64 [Paramuribaculum sp.]|nr:IgA Peptidase M64 [Paramuribaculum sp.]